MPVHPGRDERLNARHVKFLGCTVHPQAFGRVVMGATMAMSERMLSPGACVVATVILIILTL